MRCRMYSPEEVKEWEKVGIAITTESTLRCGRCGMDSGTNDTEKFAAWIVPHRAISCRPMRIKSKE